MASALGRIHWDWQDKEGPVYLASSVEHDDIFMDTDRATYT